VLLLAVAAAFAPRMSERMRDFEVYHTAAQRAAAGEPLYRAEDEHYQFKYLPGFAVLARPIGVLPLRAAKTVWFLASAVLLYLLFYGSLLLLPERRRPAWVLVLITVVVTAKFLGHELVLGQVNLLLGTLVAAATVALGRGRDAWAGALVTAAVMVKPYAVLFLPWIAAQRRWRAIVAAAAGAVVALGLPVPAYGLRGTWELHRAWWTTVTASTAPNLLNQDNVSIAAMFAKWLSPGFEAAAAAALTSLLLVGVAIFVFARRTAIRSPEILEASLLLTLLPLLSPQGWDYVFLVSIPAVMLIVNEHDRLPRPLRVLSGIALATIGLSLYDVLGRERYAAFMALSIITLCFLMVIASLVALRTKKIA
jgi:hypothetical protein